jgi:hypothetical protein
MILETGIWVAYKIAVKTTAVLRIMEILFMTSFSRVFILCYPKLHPAALLTFGGRYAAARAIDRWRSPLICAGERRFARFI